MILPFTLSLGPDEMIKGLMTQFFGGLILKNEKTNQTMFLAPGEEKPVPVELDEDQLRLMRLLQEIRWAYEAQAENLDVFFPKETTPAPETETTSGALKEPPKNVLKFRPTV